MPRLAGLALATSSCLGTSFFLDKQLSLKIKATRPSPWHCTGNPLNFGKRFINLGPPMPICQMGVVTLA